jgi:DNA-directed RNA polymerase specialized sigma24 family protein
MFVHQRKLEGYENREIARQLGISLSSVERKLRVVREKWQGCWKE